MNSTASSSWRERYVKVRKRFGRRNVFEERVTLVGGRRGLACVTLEGKTTVILVRENKNYLHLKRERERYHQGDFTILRWREL